MFFTMVYTQKIPFLIIFFLFSFGLSSLKQAKAQVPIKAEIESEFNLKLYGYASPDTIIEAASIRTFGHTLSGPDGYFIFDNLPISGQTGEICLQAIDNANRTSIPLCLPVRLASLGSGQASLPLNKHTIGPVILPPTLSLSHREIFVNQHVVLRGKSLSNSKISLSVYPGPILHQVNTDSSGNFEFPLPVKTPSVGRIFAFGEYNNYPIPKSQTLFFRVLPLSLYLIRYFLPGVLWFLTFLLTAVIIYYYNRKTGDISLIIQALRRDIKYLNGKKLRPWQVKNGLKLKLLWYNLRMLTLKRQK